MPRWNSLWRVEKCLRALLNIDDFASRLRRRGCHGRRSVLLPAQSDDDQCASGPGGKRIDHRNEFSHERRKKQWMKSDNGGQKNHDHHIENFIRPGPAKGTEGKLNHVRSHRYRTREPNAAARQRPGVAGD